MSAACPEDAARVTERRWQSTGPGGGPFIWPGCLGSLGPRVQILLWPGDPAWPRPGSPRPGASPQPGAPLKPWVPAKASPSEAGPSQWLLSPICEGSCWVSTPVSIPLVPGGPTPGQCQRLAGAVNMGRAGRPLRLPHSLPPARAAGLRPRPGGRGEGPGRQDRGQTGHREARPGLLRAHGAILGFS